MAEVQNTVASGEMTMRFLELVQMQAHSASLFLGRIPHPQTGKPEVNLQMARVFIEQLTALAFKTRGNLTPDEEKVINSTLSNLQSAYAEATKGTPAAQPASAWTFKPTSGS